MKQGYQLLGQPEAVQDVGVLDGNSAAFEGLPQNGSKITSHSKKMRAE
jgi:hypothetical protein